MNDQTDWISPEGTADTVSVIVTAYNQKDFLREALASVFAQTYRPLECVVVNDGSTDGAERVIDEFSVQAKASGVHFVPILQKNSGAQAARNAGVIASKGEFVQYLDGDDILDVKKISEQTKFLLSPAGNKVDVVFGDSRYFVRTADNEFHARGSIGIGPTEDVFLDLLNGRWNSPFAYLARRSCVSKSGPWDRELRIAQDHGYFLAMAARGGRFHHLPIQTGLYRKHSESSISEGSMRIRSSAMLRILRTVQALGKECDTLQDQHRIALARAYMRVSYWAFGLDRACWRQAVEEAIRLRCEPLPERKVDQILHKVLGVVVAETLLGRLRQTKKVLSRLSLRSVAPSHF
jgi:glycosyltransferase involved in cell wall biosynthesis